MRSRSANETGCTCCLSYQMTLRLLVLAESLPMWQRLSYQMTLRPLVSAESLPMWQRLEVLILTMDWMLERT